MVPDSRPRAFTEFIGQVRLKARIELAMAASKVRNEQLGHVLLVGPPGCGKGTLASIIAKQMGSSLKITNGADIETTTDLAGLLTNLEERDVLLIEDIHWLRRPIAEQLCPGLERSALDIIVDTGPKARNVRLTLPRFTLIGTTLTQHRLTPRLLSGFQIIETLEPYSQAELALITLGFARLLNLHLEDSGAREVSHSSDGTPGDLLRRVRHVRDYVDVKAPGQSVTEAIAASALKMLRPSATPGDDAEGRQGIPSGVRREVWRRDGGKCVKCGSRENLEYDHIIPVSKGGSNTARNVELLCEECNRSKRDSIQ